MYVMTTTRQVHAVFPGANGQIAFSQGDPSGIAFTNNVIITANPDGSNPQPVPLPAGIGVELFSSAVWSPDGSKLLISHTVRPPGCFNTCIAFRPATVKPSGKNFNLLTMTYAPFDMDCSVWSLNQTRILCSFGDLNGGVFSVRASDGGDPIRLTTNPFSANGGQDSPADISPDGKRFVFLRFKPASGPSSTPVPDAQVALFVENVDSTGLRQLTPYMLADNSSASWSPDGLKIITNMSNGAGGSANQLYTVDPNGSGLTPINLQAGTQQYSAFAPAWSPDGTRIVFCMFINGGEGIYTANPDGSAVEQVTFTTDFSNLFDEPHWGTHPVQ
jgi:Tol biopolymer transport system component